MRKLLFLSASCILLSLWACETPDPNLDKQGEDELKAHEVEREIPEESKNFQDIVYVPIYSDIYVDDINQKVLLAATLSIRNTSYKDSIFISKINYYNTEGERVKTYLENPISLPPMATINYVIERDDDSGGPGANFIVELYSKNKSSKPLIQAVMVGVISNKGFSFSTDGYSVIDQ